jgi:anti-sigma regulatory factor (Ser/Thr protein kinase)
LDTQPRQAKAHEVTFRLSRRRSSVPRARALLGAVHGEWRVGQDVLDTAELVLSELVTNAVRVRVPNGRQVEVRIAHARADGLLRLEVSDAGDGWPEVKAPDLVAAPAEREIAAVTVRPRSRSGCGGCGRRSAA